MYLVLLFCFHCHHVRRGLHYLYLSNNCSSLTGSLLPASLSLYIYPFLYSWRTCWKGDSSTPNILKLSLVHSIQKQTKIFYLDFKALQNLTPAYFYNFLPLFVYNLHEPLAPINCFVYCLPLPYKLLGTFPALLTSSSNYIESLFQFFPNIASWTGSMESSDELFKNFQMLNSNSSESLIQWV